MTRERTVGAFVRARRASWDRLAALAAGAASGRLGAAEVEELDRLYRRAAGDLARARVAFPGSDAEGHLTQLLATTSHVLHAPRRSALAALARLYREEVPASFRAERGALALALVFLGAGLAGGALAVAWEPGAAEWLVPDAVRASVAAGELWTGALLSAAPGVTGSALAHNNLTVAGLAFALGLTGGLGTALLLLANGLLLGAVTAHVVEHGLGAPFLGFLAAHGPAELSALVLAAQGGFALAGALVAPGEWSRAAALQARGRSAARLFAVVVPTLVLVAVVEAAVSPAPEWPGAAKAALGFALAGALWLYLARAGRAR